MMIVKFLISILTGFSALTFAFDVTSTCKLVKNGTYIADPSSCSGWAYCENGEVRGRGNCNSGLYYNVRTGECDYVANVDCQMNLETMCHGLDKVFKSNPNDCNQYCYCSNGKAMCQKCPDNQIFHGDKGECVWRDGSDYKCVDNSPCQLVANNQFVKNEKSCSKYFRCLNGRHIEGECDRGQNFNYLQGRCDWVKNYPCSTSSEVPSGNQPQPSPDSCSKLLQNGTTEKISFYVEDGATCRGNFYCENDHTDKASWTQCPGNTHFDFVAQKCVDSVATKCKFDRCDGLSLQFVTVLNTNCKEFNLCRNGIAVPESKNRCTKTGYEYFDEIAQACVPKKPDYKICESM